MANCDSSQRPPYPPAHTPHPALGPPILSHVALKAEDLLLGNYWVPVTREDCGR